MVGKILLSFLTGILSLLLCVVALLTFTFGPRIAYHRLVKPNESGCSSITPGMTKEQVLELLHRRKAPYVEDATEPNRWRFLWPGSGCEVEFNSQSNLVERSTVTGEGWRDGDMVDSY